MRKIIVATLAILISATSIAQTTNTFPDNGNVGIGTTNPNNGKLVIGQSLNETTGGVAIKNTNNQSTYLWMDEGNVMHIDNAANASRNVVFNSSGAGKVGIGTANPSGKLEILKNADLSNSISLPNSGLVLRADNDGSDASLRFGVDNTNLKAVIQTQQTTTGAKFELLMNPFGGNVGIGTTNPSNGKLVIGQSLNDTQGGVAIKNTNNQSTYLWMDGDNIMHIDNATNKSRNIVFNASGTGNVGIGTTDTKGYKLGVKGKIAAEEIKVALYNTWPDYVFENDYKLPSLQEVENHISEKGHLPNIPSAAEVAENGIQLGAMNAKLLEKIEELTLYMIEQNKKTEDQQQEINELRQENKLLKSLQNRLDRLESKK